VTDDTEDVLMLNVALVAPAGTSTVAGTNAEAAPDSCTLMPPAGAGPSRFTVPVADAPAVTVAGVSESAVTNRVTGGLTVTPALAVAPP
jgi:hypothetical protein